MLERPIWRKAVADTVDFLLFRADEKLWDRLGLPHFLIGLAITWFVGIGRNWDFPQAPLFAKLGLPSVVYIFVLSFVFLLASWPASSVRLNYWKILTLVSMTAAPGLVYAIPVEMMFSLETAQRINMLFLAVVAGWRVALALYVFSRAGANDLWVSASIILIPVCLVVIGLVATGRAGYMIELMGGVNRPENVNSGVDDIVSVLYLLAWPLLVLSGLLWIRATYVRWLDFR